MLIKLFAFVKTMAYGGFALAQKRDTFYLFTFGSENTTWKKVSGMGTPQSFVWLRDRKVES